MKDFIVWLILIFILVFTVKINATVTREHILVAERRNSIEKAVSDAVEQIQVVPRYMISTDEELAAEFVKTLFSFLETSEGIQINIVSVDAKAGFLDVNIVYKVTEKNEKSVRKTVILNGK